MKPKVALETLGCKLNQYETEAIAAEFLRLGWEVVDDGVPADAYVLNTCTVTDTADRKSRNALKHRDQAAPVVVVTGCFAQSAREELQTRQDITFVVPNGSKNQIAALVDAHRLGEVPTLSPADPFGFSAHAKVFRTRASLKIQEGCDNYCTFCIIPMVRGRAVSRPPELVLDEARALIAGGRKELVLTGVNVGRWQHGPSCFADLTASLLALEGDFRLRVTSLEPDGLNHEFAALLDHPKFCPHVHLCLQSGSPRQLLAMRREYNLEQYESLVRLLRARRPDINVTTDLIVGFPGETEQDFAQTVRAVEHFGFGFVHIFPFSRRQGTRADRMSAQISETEKRRRGRELQAAASPVRLEKMTSLRGQARTVLVETPDQGRSSVPWLRGFTEDYFPVRFRGSAGWNSLVRVVLVAVVEDGDGWVFEASPA